MEGTQQGDLSPPIAPQLLLEGCSLLSIISIFLRVLCLALYRHSMQLPPLILNLMMMTMAVVLTGIWLRRNGWQQKRNDDNDIFYSFRRKSTTDSTFTSH